MARKQAPDLAAPEALRVPAPVTNLYAPPSPPPIDHNLQNLGNALSAFAPSLANLGAILNKNSKKTQSELDQAAAQKFIAGHTNEEYKKAVETNAIPVYADPVANAAIQKNYGMVLGRSMVEDAINTGIKTGQIDLLDKNTNVDSIVTNASKQAIDTLNQHFPGSKYAAQGLTAIVAPLRQQLITKQQEALATDNVKQRLGVVQNTFNNIVQGAGKAGLQPDGTVSDQAATDAFNKIRQSYGELGKTLAISGRTLPPQWMDQQLMTVLANNAATNPEVVKKILSMPRKDEAGNPLPALAANPRYALQVQQIASTVNSALGKKFDTKLVNDKVQAGIQALTRQDGSIWGLHDYAYTNPYTGQHKVIAADTLKSKIMANWQTWSDQTAQQRGENSDVQFERDYNVYHQANEANPTWKAALQGVASTLSNPAALSNPATRQKAAAAGELFMKLSARDYNYVNSTMKLDQKSKAFYDAYEVARRYMGQNSDTALDTASSVVNSPENASDMNVRASQKQEIDNQVSGAYTSWWPWADKPDNLGVVKKRVGDVASVLVRIHGMDPKDAVDQAAKLIHDRSTIINGHVVTDQGYMPPKEMRQYIPKALDAFVKDQGAYNGVTDPSELSVEPAGHSGEFRIVAHGDGVPRKLFVLKDGHAVPAIITMSDLHNMQLMDRQQSDQKIINDQHQHKLSFVPAYREAQKHSAEGQKAAIDSIVHGIGVLPHEVKSLWNWATGKVREHH